MTPMHERWWREGSRVLSALILGLAVAVFIGSVAAIADIRDTQLEGTPTGKKLLASADRILDCTEPGDDTKPAGECYKRSQQQTADILSSAQRIIVLSAACAVSLRPEQTVDQRIADITNCVTQRLTRPQP